MEEETPETWRNVCACFSAYARVCTYAGMLTCKTRFKVLGPLSWIAGGLQLYPNSFTIESGMMMKWMVGGHCIFDVEEENDVLVDDDDDDDDADADVMMMMTMTMMVM